MINQTQSNEILLRAQAILISSTSTPEAKAVANDSVVLIDHLQSIEGKIAAHKRWVLAQLGTLVDAIKNEEEDAAPPLKMVPDPVVELAKRRITESWIRGVDGSKILNCSHPKCLIHIRVEDHKNASITLQRIYNQIVAKSWTYGQQGWFCPSTKHAGSY